MKASVLECLDIEASYRGSGEEGADSSSENDGTRLTFFSYNGNVDVIDVIEDFIPIT